MMERKEAGYRRRASGMFDRAFNDQIRPLYDKLDEATDIRDITLPALDNEGIVKGYHDMYTLTVKGFASDKRKQLRKSYLKAPDDDIFDDLITAEITAYINANAGSMITEVGNTSKVLLQKLLKELVPEILDQGIGGGQAVTMLRDKIESAWHEVKRYRIERITRTEVNRAANLGNFKGAMSLDMVLDRFWMSAFAAESREEHIEADGQRVRMEEPFVVMGEELKFPGDVSLGASAGNTINCLCGVYEQPAEK